MVVLITNLFTFRDFHKCPSLITNQLRQDKYLTMIENIEITHIDRKDVTAAVCSIFQLVYRQLTAQKIVPEICNIT